MSQAGANRVMAQNICVVLILSCQPHTSFSVLLWATKAPFLFQPTSLLVRGFPGVWELLFPFSFLLGGTGPNLLPLLSLSLFFFLPFISYMEIPLVLSGVWVLLPVFSRYPSRIDPFVDVFLKYLWEEVGSMSFYSATILILPWVSSTYSAWRLGCWVPEFPQCRGDAVGSLPASFTKSLEWVGKSVKHQSYFVFY